MSTTSIFIVGAPATGKTTLVRSLLSEEKDPHWRIGIIATPKWTICSRGNGDFGVFAAGHYTGAAFDGADTVPYNGVSLSIQFWKGTLLPSMDRSTTIFDGDRFSYGAALAEISASCHQCLCVLLDPPSSALSARKAARESVVGRAQNQSWAAGRGTKAGRFAGLFKNSSVLHVTDEPSVEELRDRVKTFSKGW